MSGLASISELHHDGKVCGRGEDLQQLHDVRMAAAKPEIQQLRADAEKPSALAPSCVTKGR